MDKALLVKIDLEKGGDILKMFDDAGLNVKVALWAYLSEYEDLRFIVASRKFDEVGLFDAYGLIQKGLEEWRVDGQTISNGDDSRHEDPLHQVSAAQLRENE